MFTAGLIHTDAQSPGDDRVFSHKKGVGFATMEGRFNWLSPVIDQLGCSWYYDWEPSPDSSERKVAAEYVPMIWGAKNCTDQNFLTVIKNSSKTLLGFNEPDRKDQANMSVDRALELWPKLMSTGLRLGSPAPASPNSWLPEFMRKAKARDYRVDFICLHWYGDITAPEAIDELHHLLTENWERYRKPIWLTEFSGSNGDWLKLYSPPVTARKNAEFIRKVIPMLEALSFVERYAWFELKWKKKPWDRVALADPKTGRLTIAGKAYRTTKSR